MCILCSSHTNMSKDWANIALLIERINPERGHVYLCKCGYLVYQEELTNGTGCNKCGHQILQPNQLVSNKSLRRFDGEFVNVQFCNTKQTGIYDPETKTTSVSLRSGNQGSIIEEVERLR